MSRLTNSELVLGKTICKLAEHRRDADHELAHFYDDRAFRWNIIHTSWLDVRRHCGNGFGGRKSGRNDCALARKDLSNARAGCDVYRVLAWCLGKHRTLEPRSVRLLRGRDCRCDQSHPRDYCGKSSHSFFVLALLRRAIFNCLIGSGDLLVRTGNLESPTMESEP